MEKKGFEARMTIDEVEAHEKSQEVHSRDEVMHVGKSNQ